MKQKIINTLLSMLGSMGKVLKMLLPIVAGTLGAFLQVALPIAEPIVIDMATRKNWTGTQKYDAAIKELEAELIERGINVAQEKLNAYLDTAIQTAYASQILAKQ